MGQRTSDQKGSSGLVFYRMGRHCLGAAGSAGLDKHHVGNDLLIMLLYSKGLRMHPLHESSIIFSKRASHALASRSSLDAIAVSYQA
jgi:hypothetical protein